MKLKYVKDSILNTEIEFIAHGVNCQGVMGSGVAKVLFKKYPQVREAYLEYYMESFPFVLETSGFLGLVQEVNCGEKTVFNCFTQDNFGYGGEIYGDYEAIRKCFLTIGEDCDITEVAIPKIGCGLAGLDWEIVEGILEEVSEKTGLEITVYYLE